MKRLMGRGFALPTVLIVSIVMLMILTVSVSATAASRQSLLSQYYNQLAQAAGEAGTAYAEACLAANGNIPTWSNSSPLTPKTNCSGVVVGSYPDYVGGYKSDSALSFNDIRSSFSVGLPSVDDNGRAVTIPNSGYVQLLRTSTQTVWKTYTQPNFQAAVVPDQCSGIAQSSLGWNNASLTPTSATNLIAGAETIGMGAGSSYNPGYMYYRKDFSITKAGTYNELLRADDSADVYINGSLHWSGQAGYNNVGSGSITLPVGCHSVVIRVLNEGIAQNNSNLSFSMTLQGESSPTVKTDTSWRVTAGNTVHYSSPQYHETSPWDPVRVFGVWNNPTLPWGGNPSTWGSTVGDWSGANYISTTNSASGNNYPGNQYTWLRDTKTFTLSSARNVKLGAYCDDNCTVYIDGNIVMDNTPGSGLVTSIVRLDAGTHGVAIQLYNNSGANVSAALFAIVDQTNGSTIARTDASWVSSNFWSATPAEYYSYDKTFNPVPETPRSSNVQLLLVGGGGSGGGGWQGGGGGGGGVVYKPSHTVRPGNYSVLVGAGGAGGSITTFNNGGVTRFDGVRAIGGGAGAGEPSGQTIYAQNGGSGGGASHPSQSYWNTGVIGQGSQGGIGLTGNPYVGGGGGGAGASGQNATTAKGGNGGVGVANPIVGSTAGQLSGGVYYVGGGGGGSLRGGAAGAMGIGGLGGGGTASGTGGAGLANTGGGGGAGHNGASAAGPSGAGGSGVAVIAYPTGSLNASGGTETTSGGYTIHTFTTNGTFTVASVTPVISVNVDALAVAGGGGGGNIGAAGGGGGGGVLSISTTISSPIAYPVVVGAGGAANTSGSNSSIFGFNAIGGGSGRWDNGLSGGSGGGSGRGASSTTFFASGTSGQGSVGGSAGQYSGQYPASGGGGAGGAGGSVTVASPGISGAGGPGLSSSITGAPILYGAGGGGGGDYGCSRNLGPGAGGSGGGGAGGNSSNGNGVAGSANTGSGGGGATQLSSCSASGVGGAGGSGVVIVSYQTGKLTATGGTVTYSGGYTIHRFTSDGTFDITAVNP